MEWAFFAVAVASLLTTLNAVRPVPTTIVSIASFFGGWLATELAVHRLGIQVAILVVFPLLGGLHGWQGTAAVACVAVSIAGTLYLIYVSTHAGEVAEAALKEGLGDDYVSRIDADLAARHDPSVPWLRLLLPFRMGLPEVERIRNVSYGPHGRRNKLDVYRRTDHPTGSPILLQIHGGGWVLGSKDEQGIPLMQHLASRGWVCFAANYRLGPKTRFPDMLVDLKRALAWIREHAADYGGDPGFVVVTGGSAGGHLTALVALTQNDPEYQPGFEDADTSVFAAVPYYGVYDFTGRNNVRGKTGERGMRKFLERAVMSTKLADDPEGWAKVSPLDRITPDGPPMFVIHGHNDTLVPVGEARHFVEKLRRASRQPVVYAELPGAQHAFDIFPSIRTAHVIRAIERYVDFMYSRYRAQSGRRPTSESPGQVDREVVA
ncbi:MAG: alpha/beta hydrolase [Acidimicrobiia bacterium]|nr:alpha/beta hydrolase [Acidimicrobiia bacterium]